MSDLVAPFWISAFLDFPADSFDEAVGFWSGVTGYAESARRGDDAEFATLVPRDGDDYLRVQRLTGGGPRIHLDLHVLDPRDAADKAVAWGADVVTDHSDDHGYIVLASPAGLTFCFVTHAGSRTPSPVTWPEGSVSRADQVCLDLPDSVHDQERSFWSHLLDAPIHQSTRRGEFTRLDPAPSPLRVLVQRLDEPEGPARAHLDLAVAQRPVETARHVALGATVIREDTWWTVLQDPSGLTYCLTDRPPQ